MKDSKTKIKQFLAQYFGNHQLQEDEDIFSLGFVNSMFAMQLVLFLEKEFQIVIENEDLEFENFRTINSMVRLLERKTALLTRD